jgi:hypothetical protein
MGPYVGEIWDAAPVGSSESVFAVGHKTQISKVEAWIVAEGRHGRWPFDTGGCGRRGPFHQRVHRHCEEPSLPSQQSRVRDYPLPGTQTIGVL